MESWNLQGGSVKKGRFSRRKVNVLKIPHMFGDGILETGVKSQGSGLRSQESGWRRGAGMSTRVQNEKKFGAWTDLPGGGRQYWLDVAGRMGWRARYLKEVDSQEVTV